METIKPEICNDYQVLDSNILDWAFIQSCSAIPSVDQGIQSSISINIPSHNLEIKAISPDINLWHVFI
jgi:hypothetical protein